MRISVVNFIILPRPNFSYEHVTPSQYKAMQLSGQIPMNAPIIASALLNQSSINPMVKNGQPAPPGLPSGTGAPTAPPPGGAEVRFLNMSNCQYEWYMKLMKSQGIPRHVVDSENVIETHPNAYFRLKIVAY